MKWYMGMTLKDRKKRSSQIKGNLARSRNVERENGSEQILSSFLGYKGDEGDIYF